MARLARAAVLLALAVAVSAQGKWSLVSPNLGTFIIGIGFVNSTQGFCCGDDNSGPEILVTNDGSGTWASCTASFGPDVLLLDLDATEQSIVVSSIFGELYSDNDGQSFSPSLGGGQSQSVRFLGVNGDGGKKFGTAGTYRFGKVQGVAVSLDGGATFTSYDAKLSTLARYAAFPTDTTWYVAAGEWPSTSGVKDPKRRSVFFDKNGRAPASFTPKPLGTDGWVAQIAKTTDGGNSWKTVFFNNGSFYFNGIDCDPADANKCCAVGESSGIPDAGARIYCTQDGGQTWTRTFWSPETSSSGYSLMQIKYGSSDLVWAVGAELHKIAPLAWFLESTDGGQTWNHNVPPMPELYAMSVSVVSSTVAFASVDNVITQSSGIAKYIPN